MHSVLLYGTCGIALFTLGLYGAVTLGRSLRQVLAFNIASTGASMLLIAVARRVSGPLPDPVPHAMVLTGIVVAFSATALALALINRLQRSSESVSGQDDHVG